MTDETLKQPAADIEPTVGKRSWVTPAIIHASSSRAEKMPSGYDGSINNGGAS
jgi:hypothetical protein